MTRILRTFLLSLVCMAMLPTGIVLAQTRVDVVAPAGFEPRNASENLPRAANARPGIRSSTGAEIPTERAIFELLRLVTQLERNALGSGKSYLTNGVEISDAAASQIVQLALTAESALLNTNEQIQQAMCARQDELVQSKAELLEFITNSDADIELTRQQTVQSIAANLDANSYAKLSQLARSSSDSTKTISIDWVVFLENEEIDPAVVLAAICQ